MTSYRDSRGKTHRTETSRISADIKYRMEREAAKSVSPSTRRQETHRRAMESAAKERNRIIRENADKDRRSRERDADNLRKSIIAQARQERLHNSEMERLAREQLKQKRREQDRREEWEWLEKSEAKGRLEFFLKKSKTELSNAFEDQVGILARQDPDLMVAYAEVIEIRNSIISAQESLAKINAEIHSVLGRSLSPLRYVIQRGGYFAYLYAIQPIVITAALWLTFIAVFANQKPKTLDQDGLLIDVIGIACFVIALFFVRRRDKKLREKNPPGRWDPSIQGELAALRQNALDVTAQNNTLKQRATQLSPIADGKLDAFIAGIRQDAALLMPLDRIKDVLSKVESTYPSTLRIDWACVSASDLVESMTACEILDYKALRHSAFCALLEIERS